jgi:hypothetical protein
MSSERERGPAACVGSPERGGNPTVVGDWPEPVPVTPAELDVIETWLGRLLDEILTPPGKQDRGEPPPKPARPVPPTRSEGTRHE